MGGHDPPDPPGGVAHGREGGREVGRGREWGENWRGRELEGTVENFTTVPSMFF